MSEEISEEIPKGFTMWECPRCGARGRGWCKELFEHLTQHKIDDDYDAKTEALVWAE